MTRKLVMKEYDDPLMRAFERDDIEWLRCRREVCEIAFRLLTDRMQRYGLSELQKEKFATIVEDLAEVVKE